MATKEELFAAVKTLKNHCDKSNGCLYGPCPLFWWCKECYQRCCSSPPAHWPDPEKEDNKDG